MELNLTQRSVSSVKRFSGFCVCKNGNNDVSSLRENNMADEESGSNEDREGNQVLATSVQKLIDNENFYEDAKEYWAHVNPTVNGMLGGFAKISPTDINGSRSFLRPFLKVGGGKTSTGRALDCGAGIGRITKRLLLPLFETVDMVELSQTFIDAAPQFIGHDAKRVERFICCGLQDFVPERGRYNVIWAQWVLSHLRDDDLVAFLQRCRIGLAPEGIIVVKENVAQGQEVIFDVDDSSFTRPRAHLEQVLEKSGLTIVGKEKQKGFPKDIFEVYMYALQ